MKTRLIRWIACAALLSCGWSINMRNPALQEKVVVSPETVDEAFERYVSMPPRELLAEYERLSTNANDPTTITPDCDISTQQVAVLLAIFSRHNELKKFLAK